MTVVDTTRDTEALTLTVTSQFDASVERIWQVWSDPRQLEQWWGPPGYPATVDQHEFEVGGRVTYFMTGPDGERYPGWWQIDRLEPPHLLVFTDGFADDDGEFDESLPTTVTEVTLRAVDGGTHMILVAHFPSLEAMEQILEMGAEEGIVAGLSQIDPMIETSSAPGA